MTNWIWCSTKDVFMEKDDDTFRVSWQILKATLPKRTGLCTVVMKWSGFTLLPKEKSCTGLCQMLLLCWIWFAHHSCTLNKTCGFSLYAPVYVGLSLIETSLCAQALWVDVSSGLGRSPPSSYPSGELAAAKPNLGFTAFDKPSNGTGQRAGKEREGGRQRHRELEKEGEIKISHWYGVTGWSACDCVFCFCLRIQKWDLVHSEVLLC